MAVSKSQAILPSASLPIRAVVKTQVMPGCVISAKADSWPWAVEMPMLSERASNITSLATWVASAFRTTPTSMETRGRSWGRARTVVRDAAKAERRRVG